MFRWNRPSRSLECLTKLTMTCTSRTDFDELNDQKERDLNSRPSRQELKTLPHDPPPLPELVVVNNS